MMARASDGLPDTDDALPRRVFVDRPVTVEEVVDYGTTSKEQLARPAPSA